MPHPGQQAEPQHLAASARTAWQRGDRQFDCAITAVPDGNRDLLTAISDEGWLLITSVARRGHEGDRAALIVYRFIRR